MVGRGRFPLTALAIGAALCALGVARAGGDETSTARLAQGGTSPRLVVARFSNVRGRGVVFAVRHGALQRVGLAVSLHRLQPNRNIEVVGMRRGCSAAVTGEGIAAAALFRTTVQAVEAEDLVTFVRVPLRGTIQSARSVRLYEESADGTLVQRACAPAAVFIGGGAATGALIGG